MCVNSLSLFNTMNRKVYVYVYYIMLFTVFWTEERINIEEDNNLKDNSYTNHELTKAIT